MLDGMVLESCDDVEVLASVKVGPCVVEAYRLPAGEFAYRIMFNGLKVQGWTDAREKRFPKKAAQVGRELVQNLAAAARRPVQRELF